MKTIKVLSSKFSIILGILVSFIVLLLINSFSQYLGLINNKDIIFQKPGNFQFGNISPSIPNKNSDHRSSGNNINDNGLTDIVWNNIGPSPTIEGYAGRIGFIKFDKRNDNVMYLGGADGGLWKSTDAGHSWVPKTDYLPAISCGALEIDYSTGVMYYGTGDAVWTNLAYGGEGIFRSTDFGETWNKIISAGLPGSTRFYKLLLNPAHNNILYAATPDGLYRSEDYAVSWTRIIPSSGDPLQCNDVVISPDGNNIYAIGPGNYCPPCGTAGIGYWKSSNGGSSFTQMTNTGFPHFTNLPNGRTQITLCESNPQVLYIVTMNDQFSSDTVFRPYYAYKSTNSGENFNLINNADPILWAANNGGYNMFISVSPADPDICFIGAQNIYKTKNGSDFECITGYCNATTRADFHCMDFSHNNPRSILIGCDGGAYFSPDLGVSFSNLNTGLSLTQIYRISSSPMNNGIILMGVQDMGVVKRSSARDWAVTSLVGDGGTVSFSSVSPDTMVSGLDNSGELYYSSDGGDSWRKSFGYAGKTDWLVPIAAHPSMGNEFFTARNDSENASIINIYFSTDAGRTWGSPVTSPFARILNTDIQGMNPTALEISHTNPKMLYLTTGNRIPFFNKPNLIFRSTTGGVSWEQQWLVKGGTGIIPDELFTKIKTDPFNDNEILLTVAGNSGKHVFRSIDYGISWNDITGNLPDNPVNDIVIHYTSQTSKEYFIATDKGVYRSSSDIIQWQRFGSNIPNTSIQSLDYNRLDCKLRAATFGRSIWETDIPGNIYVRDNLILSTNADEIVSINDNLVICRGGSLTIPHFCTINMAENKKIIVLSGGSLKIPLEAGAAINSISGQWGGIELFSGASAVISNCGFDNTSNPISILPVPDNINRQSYNKITISGCNFNSGSINIRNVSNVLIQNCEWAFPTGLQQSVCGIYSIGSDSVIISNNIMNCSSPTANSIGISAVFGNGVYILNNRISNIPVGISVSSNNAYISGNIVTSFFPAIAYAGIGLLNCPDGFVSRNQISGYNIGIKLLNSSPELSENDDEINTAGSNKTCGLYADYISAPRLSPLNNNSNFYYDCGKNTITSTKFGDGIRYLDMSLPDVDYGYNSIYGYRNYISSVKLQAPQLNLRDNFWFDVPPMVFKFSLPVEIVFDPYLHSAAGNLNKNGGSFNNQSVLFTKGPNGFSAQNSQLIDRGFGIYDTLYTSSSLTSVSDDRLLLNKGKIQIIQNDFQGAINAFELLLQQYKSGYAAADALNKIMYCAERLNYTRASYYTLRNYYKQICVSGTNDSVFIFTANDLSRKALIKSGKEKDAVYEYENAVLHTADSSALMSREISTIDDYTLINNGSDTALFTGQLVYLRPVTLDDAGKMIFDRAYKLNNSSVNQNLPVQFLLSQNFPNPFNPVTKIYYTIPSNVRVVLKVYDILGRLVTTLLDENKDAGYYTVTFNGVNYASGVYFYRFQAGNFTDIKKMVLLK